MATNIYNQAASQEEEDRLKRDALARQQDNQSLLSIYSRDPRYSAFAPAAGSAAPATNPEPIQDEKDVSFNEIPGQTWRGVTEGFYNNPNLQPQAQPAPAAPQVPYRATEQELPSQFAPSMGDMFSNSAEVAAPVVEEMDTSINFKDAPGVGDEHLQPTSYAPTPKVEETPTVLEPTLEDGYSEKTVTLDGTVVPDVISDPNAAPKIAMQNGIPASGANYIANQPLQYDENGIATVDASAMGLDFKNGYEYHNREVSDGQALFQGIITGGLAVLGVALAGGNSQDLGAAFFLAGANRFAGALNESARYKNIEALEKQGFTPQSIEEYVQTGDRSALKKFEIEDWKEYPDGSGRMYRQLPDGKVQFMKGQPKWEPISMKKGWKTVQRYRNPVTGEYMMDADGKTPKEDELDDGFQAQQNFNQRAVSQGKESAADKKTAAKLAEQNKSVSAKIQNYRRDIVGRTSHFRDADGNWKKSDGSMSHSPTAWVAMGGGYGKFPPLLDQATALTGSKNLRDDIIKAQQVGAQMMNLGIQAARDAGASGINTVAEIERFKQSMPQVDYSSYDNMIASLQEIENYTNQFLADLERQITELNSQQPAQPQTQAPRAQPQQSTEKKPLYSVNGKSTNQRHTSPSGVAYTVE